jgi:hypothetical protein
MVTFRADKVQAAIQNLRDFYDTGRESLRKRPGRAKYGAGENKEEAAELGMNPDTLGKARQFADPDEGYTPKELSALCRLIKQVQSGQKAGTSVFTVRHVICLLSVWPKSRREATQRKAIKKGWTTDKLEREVRSQGKRSKGGRPPRVARNMADFLSDLARTGDDWCRWRDRLDEVPKQAGGHVVWGDLSAELQSKIDALRAAWQGVQTAVKEEPRRQKTKHAR